MLDPHRFGDAHKMGPQLRDEVERQLLADLKHYGIEEEDLIFNWRQSCIEGHHIQWLDGDLENFSGIGLLDASGQSVGHGWMDFALTDHRSKLLIYWDFLWFRDEKLKRWPGAPDHIWSQLSAEEKAAQHWLSPRKPPQLP